MIVLITPKGWTGPRRSMAGHRGVVPLPSGAALGLAQNPEHLALLEQWMTSYRPEELFDETGAPIPELRALAPKGERRMGATRTPTAACCCATSSCPTSAPTPSTCRRPATVTAEATRCSAPSCAT
jgi:xylulose-5-phosphate/fructose-6-phosphate phosphoketolase